jgi:hypothetical protein
MTTPRMRAGHTDRQAAVDGLTRHFTEGRLNPDEFDERVGKAYAATHLDELPVLFTDLPPDPSPRRPESIAGRSDRSGSFPADARMGRGYGPRPMPFHRPPRILVVLPVIVTLAMLFSIGALAQGVFPFPLLWIALLLLFLARGSRRRRWAHYRSYHDGRRPDGRGY